MSLSGEERVMFKSRFRKKSGAHRYKILFQADYHA